MYLFYGHLLAFRMVLIAKFVFTYLTCTILVFVYDHHNMLI